MSEYTDWIENAEATIEAFKEKSNYDEQVIELHMSGLTFECHNIRKSLYPSIEEQLDYIYHNGVEAWKTDMITPIKEKFPKP